MEFRTGLIFAVLIFLFVDSVFADNDFNLDASLKWINKTVLERDWSGSNDEISYTILALSANAYNVEEGINELTSKRSGDGSWNNDVYDTSLAILALHRNNKNVESSVNWLMQQQIKAQNQGRWLVQIRTDQLGSCGLSLSDSEPVSFNVNSTGASCDLDQNGDGWGSWIDLESCAGFNLDYYEEVLVNCNNLGNSDISLLYNTGNNYYIMDDKQNTNRATLIVQNAYFGDYDKTAYASWVLSEIGKQNQVYTTSYLRSNARRDNIVDRSILYMITNDKVYSDWLIRKQSNFTGSWDGNIFNTAFAILALGKNSPSGTKGIQWIKGEQNTNNRSSSFGSWNSDLRDTSFTVWSVFSSGSVINRPGNETRPFNETRPSNTTTPSSNICGNDIRETGEDCDARYSESGTKIRGDDDRCGPAERCRSPDQANECTCQSVLQEDKPCSSDTECDETEEFCDLDNNVCVKKECTTDSQCNPGEICNLELFTCEIEDDSQFECTIDDNCNPGEECLSNKCEAIEGWCDNDNDCDEGFECDTSVNRCFEKKSSFPWWIITIVVLAIAGGVLFFALKKRGSPKKFESKPVLDKREKPIMRPAFKMDQYSSQNSTEKRDMYDERIESELDQSIKRAKELLGKK